VVSEAVRRNFNFWQFLKFYIRPPVSDFVFLKIYFMLDGLILFRKGDFCSEVLYVSRVVFKGGILGGARQFWGNPYLNSTTSYCLIYKAQLHHSNRTYTL